MKCPFCGNETINSEDEEIFDIVEEAKTRIYELVQDRQCSALEKLFESHYAGYLSKFRRRSRFLSTAIGTLIGILFMFVFGLLVVPMNGFPVVGGVYSFGLFCIIFAVSGGVIGYEHPRISRQEKGALEEFYSSRFSVEKSTR